MDYIDIAIYSYVYRCYIVIIHVQSIYVHVYRALLYWTLLQIEVDPGSSNPYTMLYNDFCKNYKKKFKKLKLQRRLYNILVEISAKLYSIELSGGIPWRSRK